MFFDKAVNQFCQVEPARHMPEFAAQLEEVFTDFGLGDNIEVATKCHL